MKTLSTLILCGMIFSSAVTIGSVPQQKPPAENKQGKDKPSKKLPPVKVYDMNGNMVDVSTLSNDGKPFALFFWATWCAPCLRELNNVAELYEEWRTKTGLKIYAVSVDDSQSSAKVLSVVKGKRWKFEILLDKNQDLMRAMNFQMPPFTVLCDGKGNIIYTHNSYVEGDEFLFEEKLNAISVNDK
jgi:thiol-disulfide isomerase/thioredoxin